MKDQYTFQEFLEIIARLRGENGCPWDKQQTHESLRPCMMEEAAELVAAIRILKETGDDENLKEELGDVLLQVAMHSQIAKEEGRFAMEDVISEISRKMIRRHPHVFEDMQVDSAKEVLRNWEEIKRQEKAKKHTKAGELSEIPIELPALTRAQKVSKKTDGLNHAGETYEHAMLRIQKLISAFQDAKEENCQEALNEIMGELLFSLAHISRLMGIHAEQVLSDTIYSKIAHYGRFMEENL